MRADRTSRPKFTSKPTSSKQAEANRLNAKKSTGPRTAAGRARSRMNALRHGLCARVVLLPGEDRGEYDIFAKEIVDELKPKGFVQQMLAGRVAALFWQLYRLPGAVKQIVDHAEDKRWYAWFVNRGLKQAVWIRANYAPTNSNPSPKIAEAYAQVGFDQTDEEFIDRELERAYADGDPPPERHEPPGVIADAVAGQHGFEAVLKLDDYERRLWSAVQSALRSLERRQKIDGCAEEREGGGADEVVESGEISAAPREPDAVDAGSHDDIPRSYHCEPTAQNFGAAGPPLAVSQTDALSADCETASGDRPGGDVVSANGIAKTSIAPARNEPDSAVDMRVSGELSGEPKCCAPTATNAGNPTPNVPCGSHITGAERTHLSGDPCAQSPNEIAPEPAPPPPN